MAGPQVACVIVRLTAVCLSTICPSSLLLFNISKLSNEHKQAKKPLAVDRSVQLYSHLLPSQTKTHGATLTASGACFAPHSLPETERMSFAKEKTFIHKVVKHEEVGAALLKTALRSIHETNKQESHSSGARWLAGKE